MFCLVAQQEGRIVGFANTVIHLNTWSTQPVAYLEDLFVAAEGRRKGVARALIDALAARGRSEGWHRLYWMTKRDNVRARALYDIYAPVTDFVRYDFGL